MFSYPIRTFLVDFKLKVNRTWLGIQVKLPWRSSQADTFVTWTTQASSSTYLVKTLACFVVHPSVLLKKCPDVCAGLLLSQTKTNISLHLQVLHFSVLVVYFAFSSLGTKISLHLMPAQVYL